MHSVKNEASSNSRDINHCFFNNFSYNYIALYNLGGIIMHRAISNYKITKRKDGCYYVRIRGKGDVTHIYGKQRPRLRQNWRSKLKNWTHWTVDEPNSPSLPETLPWQTGRTYAWIPFALPPSAEIPISDTNGTFGYTLANWPIRPSLRSQTLWKKLKRS